MKPQHMNTKHEHLVWRFFRGVIARTDCGEDFFPF